jgi:DNA-binding response OmpR family regulator
MFAAQTAPLPIPNNVIRFSSIARTVGPMARLTRKEARLLQTLKENPGTCLSRDYLLQTVWGYRQGVRTRTVDVHIQRLRRKLGAEGERNIKTIFRSGYIWYGAESVAV